MAVRLLIGMLGGVYREVDTRVTVRILHDARCDGENRAEPVIHVLAERSPVRERREQPQPCLEVECDGDDKFAIG